MTPAEYRRALDRIVQRLLVALIPALRVLFRSGLTDAATRRRRVDVATRVLVVQLRLTRALVADLAGRYLTEQAKVQAGVDNAFVPPVAGYSEAAVRSALESAVDQHLDSGSSRSDAVEHASATLVRHAEQAGRQMIVDAVEPADEVPDETIEEQARDPEPTDSTPVPEREPKPRKQAKDKRRPVAWARGLTGADNCAFCVMLASRGAVYKSKRTARRTEWGERYHDNCDCVPIAVYTSAAWEGKATADALFKLWEDSTKGFYQGDAINALRRELYRKERAGEPLIPGFKPMREAA